jgi:hypothetical protein
MSMARRSHFGFRFISLLAAAATLLAAWLPPGRACACGSVSPNNTTAAAITESAPACPCCGKRPDEAPRPCCPPPTRPGKPAPSTECDCGPLSGPANSEPTAPPRPAGSDDGSVVTAAPFAPPASWIAVPIGPLTAEVAVHVAGPPPIDLVISLSRLTC